MNRATQHPPLYYSMALGISHVAASLVPALYDAPFDQQMLLYRMVGVLMLLPVPFFTMLVCFELGYSKAVGRLALLLTLAIPGFFTRSGTMINNDALLILLTSWWFYTLIRLHRAPTSRSSAVAGLATGLCLFTKGLALIYPLVVGAVLISAVVKKRIAWKSFLGLSGVSGAVCIISGGWWWLRNYFVLGELQPLVQDPGPLNPQPLSIESVDVVLSQWIPKVFRAFWGLYVVPAPQEGVLFGVLAVVTALLLVSGIVVARHRGLVTIFMAVPTLVMSSVLLVSLLRYLDFGIVKGLQGRYLYSFITVMTIVAASGLLALCRHREVIAIGIAGVGTTFMMTAGFIKGLRPWGMVGADLQSQLSSMIAWSPVRPGLTIFVVVAWIALLVTTPAVLVGSAQRDTRRA